MRKWIYSVFLILLLGGAGFAENAKKSAVDAELVEGWKVLNDIGFQSSARSNLAHIEGIQAYSQKLSREGLSLDLSELNRQMQKRVNPELYLESIYKGQLYGGQELPSNLLRNLSPVTIKQTSPQYVRVQRFNTFDMVISGNRIYVFDGIKGGKRKWTPLSSEGTDQFSFVIGNDGKLRIGYGHYNLSNSSSSVLSAGSIRVTQGKITFISNGSGHYLPTVEDLDKVIPLFQNLGLMADNVKISRIKLKFKKK